MDSRVSAMWTGFRAHRLASIFFILATLAVGILIGTVVSSGVRGQEAKKVSTSDATPLTIPSPQQLSNQLSQIAAQRKSSMLLLPYGIPIAIGSILYFAWMGMLI